ncbi:peptidoglycan DD-metalloendopeptidase family protein [Nocardia asiatica]
MAPTAMAVGSAALTALPMLASALAGLSGDRSRTQDADQGGLAPEARQALRVLKALAALYGAGGTTSDSGQLGSRFSRLDGRGAVADAVDADALFLKNAARTFNDLDNELAGLILRLAGSNKLDRTAIRQLLREVNVQLAELGDDAFTRAGWQQVHRILTAALERAQAIVRDGQARASATAAAVNQLTGGYLNGIAGRPTTRTVAGRRTARTAVPRLGNGRARLPLDKYTVTSNYGPRHGELHRGVDLAAPGGTPIYAATGGIVIQAGDAGDGYGYQVRMRADDGTETIYAHQQAGSIRVTAGEEIPAGTVIGAVGSTGNSTGNHLHYEVRRNGRAIDPTAYLAASGLLI